MRITATVPSARPVDVDRQDLMDSMRGFRGRVITLCAPAGYGKSTTAAQFCRADPRPTIWLESKAADNDPISFTSRIIEALGTIDPLDADADAVLTGGMGRLEPSLLPTMARCVTERSPLIIAFDDVHEIASSGSLDALRLLVTTVPSGSTVVLTSRSEGDIGLSRLRAAHDVLEVGATDLAMDVPTASRLLVAAMRRDDVVVDLDDVATALVADTEGWPAGVGLAALALQDGPAGRLRHRHDFTAYFDEEVMRGLDDGVATFLAETALLDRFTPELCDIALERNDSSRLLRRLERSNVFLVALDDGYRYHALFRDALAERVGAIPPQRRVDILVRAAQWRWSRGQAAEAIVAAAASGDRRLYGDLVLDSMDQYAITGQLESLRMLIELASDDDIAAEPGLAATAAQVYARVAAPERAHMFARSARGDDLDRLTIRGDATIRTVVLATRSTVAPASVSEMFGDGAAIVDQEQHRPGRWLVAGYRTIGCAHLYRGETSDAVALLDEAIARAKAAKIAPAPRLAAVSFSLCALLDAGELDRAAARWDTESGFIAQARVGFVDGVVSQVAESGIHVGRGELVRARDALDAATPVLLTLDSFALIMVDLLIRAADTANELNLPDHAARFCERARTMIAPFTDAGTLPDRLAVVSSRVDLSRSVLDGLTPAERRVLQQLTTHRTLEEIGAVLYVSRATVKTHVSSIYSKLGVSGRSEAVALLQSSTGRRDVLT
jgi:LuxR family maltose regulon positive regulatory protein